MRARPLLSWMLLAAICLCAGPIQLMADDGDSPGLDEPRFNTSRVNTAIARGIVFLRKKQGRNGSWGGTTGGGAYGGGVRGLRLSHPAGPSALVLYALLHCGRTLKDPMVRRAFEHLHQKQREPGTSYEVSALLLAVTATAKRGSGEHAGRNWKLSGRNRGWAAALAAHLVEKRTARGWRYNLQNQVESQAAGGSEDLSSTHLAALALFAAQRCGIKTSRAAWEDVLSYSRDQQEYEGRSLWIPDPEDPTKRRRVRARGFAYTLGYGDPEAGKPAGSMTAAGIANVEMARYVLSEGGRRRDAWVARADARRTQESILDGIGWLQDNWSPFENPNRRGSNRNDLSWIFALACAMDLLGLERLGEHAWFDEVGQQLVNRQHKNGCWDTHSSADPSDTLDTALALLFLSRPARVLIPHPHVTGGRREPFVEEK